MGIICKSCGFDNENLNARFCNNCGAKIEKVNLQEDTSNTEKATETAEMAASKIEISDTVEDDEEIIPAEELLTSCSETAIDEIQDDEPYPEMFSEEKDIPVKAHSSEIIDDEDNESDSEQHDSDISNAEVLNKKSNSADEEFIDDEFDFMSEEEILEDPYYNDVLPEINNEKISIPKEIFFKLAAAFFAMIVIIFIIIYIIG